VASLFRGLLSCSALLLGGYTPMQRLPELQTNTFKAEVKEPSKTEIWILQLWGNPNKSCYLLLHGLLLGIFSTLKLRAG
jgi:hypothetical protein